MIIADLNILETVTAENVIGGCCSSRHKGDEKYYDEKDKKDKKDNKNRKDNNDKKYDDYEGKNEPIELTITQDVKVIQEISFN
ncbi:hypothetical protein [Nodularia sphaerocarpa]|uniref:hypothetical protein n=1 Tax=Nodularia sphaerocarpa TaxID=137816 RepID=UPI001EFB9CA7|nr:hypothetical protein [Nodularia sphaerocarpa]MDB9375538.1 hypothetical protein [Nodularia sphaerocarpa CS-585]MDB9379632.1 hypothetical protein [Nodularia sphaerocarpa CS-585A2]ULP73851.1 hypothetical protein BDGGKGIB_03511 [Nodularia sphaerocarpa UHCC 0038]